ncbi:MBL fold metallo-hydrolase [Nocardia asteroides]|uniref:MBL fold metallo-hydrolase n=1 Tax=Nocardia asteroides TaxID=1824 RepID=UPI0037CC7628
MFRRGAAVCHCLLIETPNDGLILVDTGIGERDLANPRKNMGLDVELLLHPVRDRRFTAPAQVTARGYEISDVRHILVTHLDVDHRGALADFPNATVHSSDIELNSVLKPQTRMDRRRYAGEWHRSLTWQAHKFTGDFWYGLPVVHETVSTVGRVVMVHLPGHSSGHCGVAIETGGDSPKWILHAGDSVQNAAELHADQRVPLGIKLFNTIMEADHASRLRTRARLRELAKDPDIEIICAHDADLLPQSARIGHDF